MKQIIDVSSEELSLSIDVTSDHVLGNHVVFFDLVDRFALPEFFTSCQKISSSLLASCPCERSSSCSSGTRCEFLSHPKVDPLELE